MYGHPDRAHPGHFLLAENRTATKAAIKRASAQARGRVERLAGRSARELERQYRSAAKSLAAEILATAAPDGNVKVQAMQSILDGVRRTIADLARDRDTDLDTAIIEAARLGVDPFEAAALTPALAGVADEAARFVHEFKAADGLRLSDRLWRVDAGAYRAIEDQLQQSVIRGDSATRATADFLARGVAVPEDVRAGAELARATRVARIPGAALLRAEDGAYAKALRVFRTEINRAHGEAYQAAALQHPEAIGTRFLLSPNHPRADICDLHASVNLYGLGPGVYPPGQNPWPAHPNTMSFVEVVFRDEVSRDDRSGKEDREDWLRRQSATRREGVLGGKHKRAAFDAGLISQREMSTPWRVIARRLVREGVDIEGLLPDDD